MTRALACLLVCVGLSACVDGGDLILGTYYPDAGAPADSGSANGSVDAAQPQLDAEPPERDADEDDHDARTDAEADADEFDDEADAGAVDEERDASEEPGQ